MPLLQDTKDCVAMSLPSSYARNIIYGRHKYIFKSLFWGLLRASHMNGDIECPQRFVLFQPRLYAALTKVRNKNLTELTESRLVGFCMYNPSSQDANN